MDEWTKFLTNGRKDEILDEWTNGRKGFGRMDGGLDEWTKGRNFWTNGRKGFGRMDVTIQFTMLAAASEKFL